MRAIPVLLAALLVCAAVGAGALPVADRDRPAASTVGPTTADAPAATAANATDGTTPVRVLSLNDSDAAAADIDVVTIDAGSAAGFGADASAARVETLALRERVERANTSDERQIRILDGLNEVDKQAITLRSRQEAAIADYAAGEITADELLVELARIRASAAVLEDRVELLTELAAETEGFSLDDSRVFPLLYDLRTFDGPVRERTVRALEGDRDASTRVYVAATDDGVVVSTVADDQYVREAFRADLHDRSGAGINEGTAQNVTQRSYPEIYDAAAGTVSGQGSGGTFLFDLAYPNGTLTAFVGGGTERVFMEHQRVDLAGVPAGSTVSRTLDLTLRVNRTFPGGPLRVAVVDPTTGEPVDAVVKLGREGGESTEIGTTGDDGVLWTVSPRGEFVVTVVEVGSTDVSTVGVTPTEPVAVEGAFASGDDGE